MKNKNKLIAEFMDLETPNGIDYEYLTWDGHRSELTHFTNLHYHERWDWLMPVKDKIIPLTDDLPPEYYDMIVNGLITGDIHQVYNSCVEVIKLTIKK